jgi:hypothetical protein
MGGAHCSLASTCDKTSQLQALSSPQRLRKACSFKRFAARTRWHIHCFDLVITSCPNEALAEICPRLAPRAQKGICCE